MSPRDPLVSASLGLGLQTWIIRPDYFAWDLELRASLTLAQQACHQLNHLPSPTNHKFDKGQVFIIQKEFSKLKLKSNAIIKQARSISRHFSKGVRQMANRPMKRWPVSPVKREAQIKATVSYRTRPNKANKRKNKNRTEGCQG